MTGEEPIIDGTIFALQIFTVSLYFDLLGAYQFAPKSKGYVNKASCRRCRSKLRQGQDMLESSHAKQVPRDERCQEPSHPSTPSQGNKKMQGQGVK